MQEDTLNKLNEIDVEVAYKTYTQYTATAYCSCEKCCGQWAVSRGSTVRGASGTELIPGYSVANNVLPLGTVIRTNDGTEYRVDDKTAVWVNDKYDGKVIDIYFTDHDSAIEFGKQVVWVETK